MLGKSDQFPKEKVKAKNGMVDEAVKIKLVITIFGYSYGEKKSSFMNDPKSNINETRKSALKKCINL
jgi:hypothetical protein